VAVEADAEHAADRVAAGAGARERVGGSDRGAALGRGAGQGDPAAVLVDADDLGRPAGADQRLRGDPVVEDLLGA
jgi:hypothetical protein